MTPKEHLAAAKLNLAPTLQQVRRSPESLALLNVISAVEKLADAPKPVATPVKRVPLGKAK